MAKHYERKKAQEEIVGFVLVIVLIAVISLVFLGLQLSKKPEVVESKHELSLIDAMLKYTTDCSVYPPEYESFADMIKSCYQGKQCINGVSSCQALNSASAGMLDAVLPSVSSDRPITAYQMNISYSTTQFVFGRKPQDSLLMLGMGKCSGSSISAKEFLPLDEGNIEIILKLCY